MARKFGVEIEMIGGTLGYREVSALLGTVGVRCEVEGYNHARRGHWKLVGDGSVRGQNAMELVSPPLKGKKGVEQVALVARTLVGAGVTVNATCGLHVHVDAAGLTPRHLKNIAKLIAIHEEHIKAVLPASRRNSHWAVWPSALPQLSRADVSGRCAQIDRCNDVPQLLNLWGRDRYRAVNFEALSRHNTIEFRAHSGTVDAQKITAWIALCTGIVRRAEVEADLTPVWGCGKPRCFQDVARLAGRKNEKYFFERREQLEVRAAA